MCQNQRVLPPLTEYSIQCRSKSCLLGKLLIFQIPAWKFLKKFKKSQTIPPSRHLANAIYFTENVHIIDQYEKTRPKTLFDVFLTSAENPIRILCCISSNSTWLKVFFETLKIYWTHSHFNSWQTYSINQYSKTHLYYQLQGNLIKHVDIDACLQTRKVVYLEKVV